MRGKKQAAAFRSFTVLLPPTNRVKNKNQVRRIYKIFCTRQRGKCLDMGLVDKMCEKWKWGEKKSNK